MARNIVTEQKIELLKIADNNPTPKPDNYSAQIIKLIPADVVGVYLGISALISTQGSISDHVSMILQMVTFVLILIITPFYLWKAAGITDKIQITIATMSFIIWAISLGGPFELLLKDHLPSGLTVKFLGGILIMIYTLIVPMFYRAVPKP